MLICQKLQILCIADKPEPSWQVDRIIQKKTRLNKTNLGNNAWTKAGKIIQALIKIIEIYYIHCN